MLFWVAPPSPKKNSTPSNLQEVHQQLYTKSTKTPPPDKPSRIAKKKENDIDKRTLQERIEEIQYEKEMLELESNTLVRWWIDEICFEKQQRKEKRGGMIVILKACMTRSQLCN